MVSHGGMRWLACGQMPALYSTHLEAAHFAMQRMGQRHLTGSKNLISFGTLPYQYQNIMPKPSFKSITVSEHLYNKYHEIQ
jgi:hypothetical protein